MEVIAKFISIALVAVFAENSIFARGLGSSTMLNAAKNKAEIAGFGISITFISTISSAISFFADKLYSDKALSYIYMPLIYVLIIGFVYISTLLCLWKWMPNLFIKIKRYVHISAFNCAVLGALFINSQNGSSFSSYIGHGFGTGIGFIFATYLVSIGYKKLNSDKVPESFRGLPIMLIYIGILSLAFYGMLGYQVAL